jgi:hypothetical protein
VLGRRGAPRISFDEFKKLRLVVDGGGQVFFLGTGSERIPLKARDSVLRIDKGIRDGSAVH